MVGISRLGLICTALLLSGLSHRAQAAPLAPLVPEVEPARAEEMVVRYQQALAKGLGKGGLAAQEVAGIRKKLGDSVKDGCAVGPCVAAAQARLGIVQVGTAAIKAVGKNYSIEVRVFDGNRLVARAEGRCDICTTSEALDALEEVATKAAGLARKEGLGTVVSAVKPLKAKVPPTTTAPVKVPPTTTPRPDASKAKTPQGSEAKQGGTAATAKPPAAANSTHATAPVTKTTPKAVTDGDPKLTTANAGGEPKRDKDLETTPVPPPAGHKRKWPLWPAVVAAGVGVVGLVIGAPLLAIDGDYTGCSGPPAPDGSNCADIYRTGAGGAVAMGMGLAALAASGVFFYLHFRSDGDEQAGVKQVSIVPTANGGLLMGASGRF
jgi:hypothetical protein